MLSRVAAQAARAAARPSTVTTTSPLLRSRTAVGSLSPWSRTYAKKTPKHFLDKDASKAPSSPSGKKPEEAPSQEAARDAAAKEEELQRKQEEEEAIAFKNLPDLTQGIPSTFEAEMNKASGKGQGSSALEAVEEEENARGGQGREKYEYVSTSDRNRQWWAKVFGYLTVGGFVFGVGYLGRNWDTQAEEDAHKDIPNGWSPLLWWQRARARMGDSVGYYQEPSFDKLLPDPESHWERPYTLVLSLDDLLVHSEWSREHGWRIAKRPGMDYFIRYLGQYYELVLFTTVPWSMAEPVVRKLDPYHLIMWPLFREATKYEDGEIVKDLSYLNRDLSKVIVIDSNKSHVRKQLDNAIILDPWKGDPKDKELVSLVPFLEYIHTMQYDDVRKVLKSFEGQHIPTEFARREAIARKEFNAQRAKHSSSKKHTSGFGALSSALGLKPSNMSMTVMAEGEQNPSEAFAEGKMLQDIARERGRRNYEILEREIRENGEKWLKEEKEMMDKAQAEAMSNMMSGGLFGMGGSAPAPAEKKA